MATDVLTIVYHFTDCKHKLAEVNKEMAEYHRNYRKMVPYYSDTIVDGLINNKVPMYLSQYYRVYAALPFLSMYMVTKNIDMYERILKFHDCANDEILLLFVINTTKNVKYVEIAINHGAIVRDCDIAAVKRLKYPQEILKLLLSKQIT